MLEPVFGNATIEKVLFSLETYGKGYPAGLAKLFGIPVNGIQQQLKRLEDGGVVVSLMAGRTRFISLIQGRKIRITVFLQRADVFVW